MPEVRSFSTSEASPEELQRIRHLLDRAFDGEFSAEDWEHTIGGHHVTVTHDQRLLAHAAVVPRRLEVGGRPVHTGYVEGVATAPEEQRSGSGSLAMTEVAEIIRTRYEMGTLSTDRPGFYERLGWERWRGPSYVRTVTGLVRTEEEDAGLLVLRFGPSAALSLDLSITCEARSGDDW